MKKTTKYIKQVIEPLNNYYENVIYIIKIIYVYKSHEEKYY